MTEKELEQNTKNMIKEMEIIKERFNAYVRQMKMLEKAESFLKNHPKKKHSSKA